MSSLATEDTEFNEKDLALSAAVLAATKKEFALR